MITHRNGVGVLLLFLIGTSFGVRFDVVAPTWAAILLGMALTTFGGWLLAQRGQQSTEQTAGAGSVWDVIPSWQYTGRHVESGGLTRDEQEQAIEEVQLNADALEHPQKEVQKSREN